MNKQKPTQLDRVVLGLLGALVTTNAVFLILVPKGGPLIGLIFYLAQLVLVWQRRQKGYQPVVVAGLVGLAVHLGEVIFMGWSAYPVLMALNLIFPAALVAAAWLAGGQHAHPDR